MNMQAHSAGAHPNNPAKHKEHMAVLDLVKHGDATHVAVKSGNWSDASTWKNGRVPGDGAKVLIGDGLDVTYNAKSNARLKTIRVDGQLDFATKQDTKLVIDTFVVAPNGKLTIGTKNNPVAGNVNTEILIADNGKIDRRWDPTQISRGIISHGEVEIYGQEKTGHIKLAKDAMAGDRELVLANAPKNWKVGDSLVLTGTERVPDKWNPQKRQMEWQGTQDEELTIKAINGNRVTLDRPLTYDHDTPRGDLKAYVTNFSRNVTVASENADRLPANQRGHVMFMHSDDVDVRYAEFHELGRSDKSKLFDDFRVSGNGDRIMNGKTPQPGAANNIRGRYAVHFHRSGTDVNGEPARAVGNSVWGSPGWGFVNHDSHVVMEDNAAYDVFGSAFVTETGNETGAMRNNIAIKSEGSLSISKELRRTKNHDIGHNGAGFWFQGRLVDNEGNIAAGQRHAGSVYLLRGEDQINVRSQDLEFPETARYRDSLLTGRPHIESFKDHEVFASNKGLEVIKANPRQEHDVRSVIDGLKAWEVRTGTHLEYTSKYTLKDIDLIGSKKDSHTGISFGNNAEDMVVNGAKVKGFGLGVRTTKKHTLTNLKDWGYVFIDSDIEGNKVNVDGDRFMSSSQLKKGQLGLKLNGNTDFHFNGGETININGTKTDSIGSVGYWTGSDSYKITGAGMRDRIRRGHYVDKNGTPFVTIEERIADRATGETLKLEYAVTIDKSQGGLLSNSPRLGTFQGTVQRGVVRGDLRTFLNSMGGGNHGGGHGGSGDHSSDHGGMDMGDMDMGSPGDSDAPKPDMDPDMGNDMDMGDDKGDMGAGDSPKPDAGPVPSDGGTGGGAGGSAGGDAPSAPTGDPIRLEAEDMTLDGYRIEGNGGASGQELISFVRGQANETGSASTTFNGPAGTYAVKVAYVDETDGQGSLEVKVNGDSLEAWKLDQNLGDSYISDRSRTARTLGDRVSLSPGDRLQVIGQEQADEHARVDYVEVTPVATNSGHSGNDGGAEDGGSSPTPGSGTDGSTGGGTPPQTPAPGGSDADSGMDGGGMDNPAPADPMPQNPAPVDPAPAPTEPVPADPAPAPTNPTPTNPGDSPMPSADPIRLEAEDMSLSGYRIEQNGTFSDNKAISLAGQQANETGRASTTFDGPAGTYDVKVSYTDENDGKASLEAKLNGQSLDQWQLDQNLQDGYISPRNQVQRTVAEGVTLEAGDRFELMAQEQGSEHARVDYVEFVPVASTPATGTPETGTPPAPPADPAPPAAPEPAQPAPTTVLSSPVTLQGSAWKSTAIDYQVMPNTMMQVEFRSSTEGAIHAIGLDDNAIIEASDRSELVQLSGTEAWGAGDFDYVTSSGWQSYDIPIGQFASSDAAYLSLFSMGNDAGEATSEFRNVRLYEALGSGSSALTGEATMADPMTQSGSQSALSAMTPEQTAA